MTYQINETHDPNLKSWVESANDPDTDLPIQNLPFCVFEPHKDPYYPDDTQAGVIIGESVLSLGWCYSAGLISGFEPHVGDMLAYGDLNLLTDTLGQEGIGILRKQVQNLLAETSKKEARELIEPQLLSAADVKFIPPLSIRD